MQISAEHKTVGVAGAVPAYCPIAPAELKKRRSRRQVFRLAQMNLVALRRAVFDGLLEKMG